MRSRNLAGSTPMLATLVITFLPDIMPLPFARVHSRLWMLQWRASRSARPSRALLGAPTVGRPGCQWHSTEVWMLTRFGTSGDVCVATAVISFSSASPRTLLATKGADVSCSAAMKMAGRGWRWPRRCEGIQGATAVVGPPMSLVMLR